MSPRQGRAGSGTWDWDTRTHPHPHDAVSVAISCDMWQDLEVALIPGSMGELTRILLC